MSKLLVVFGATGQQGGSVVNSVLNDAELSQRYKIRAITRDPNSAKAQQLTQKVEVVRGDVSDPASLDLALAGAHAVFLVTAPDFGPDAVQVEFESGRAAADAMVRQGVENVIFSTLPHVSQVSGGKHTAVTAFDAKAKIENYIRGLNIKSAFFSAASFMENFESQPFLAPRKGPDGKWTITRPHSDQMKLPLINAVSDIGKFVGAMLAEPGRFYGKTVHGAVGQYTMKEVTRLLSKSAGQDIAYKQVSAEEFRASLGLPPPLDELFTDYFGYWEEYSYFGLKDEATVSEAITWAVANARGHINTLEEFLEAHPFRLE